MSTDSFGARSTLAVSGRDYEVFRLDALQERFDVARPRVEGSAEPRGRWRVALSVALSAKTPPRKAAHLAF